MAANRLKLYRQDDYTGGLNLRADPFQLAENESPDLLNVDVDPRGGFSMRPGFVRMNTTVIGATANGDFYPNNLFYWKYPYGGQLLTSFNGDIYWSDDGITWADTLIPTTSGDDGANFASWATTDSVGLVYVAAGQTTASYKWNSTTATALTPSGAAAWQNSLASPTGTHMPYCELIATHGDKLFVGKTTEDATRYANRIRWSHPGFPESWREIDYIDIPGQGGAITALVPWGDALFVFKEHSVFALYGYDSDTYQIVQVDATRGVFHQKLVAPTPHGLYFFDWPSGVNRIMAAGTSFATSDTNGVQDVFARIRPLIADNLVNEYHRYRTFLSHAGNRIWLSIASINAGNPTWTFVYDYTINAWTLYTLSDGTGLGPMVDFIDYLGLVSVVGLHSRNGYLLKLTQGTYTDDLLGTPTAYDSHYVTHWVDGGLISAKKMWRQPDFVVKQPSADTTLSISIYHDWEEAQPRRFQQLVIPGNGAGLVWRASATEPDAYPGWGQANWGSSAVGSQYHRGQRLGLARAISLKIVGPGSMPWGVNSITYKYTPRRVR